MGSVHFKIGRDSSRLEFIYQRQGRNLHFCRHNRRLEVFLWRHQFCRCTHFSKKISWTLKLPVSAWISGYPFIVTHHWVENTDQVKNLNSCIEKKGNRVFTCLEEVWKDFPVNCHSLASFYGLGEFVIISPAGNEALSTESRINLVLSSITMSVSNIQW